MSNTLFFFLENPVVYLIIPKDAVNAGRSYMMLWVQKKMRFAYRIIKTALAIGF